MGTRLVALLAVVSVLICGCSRRPKSVPYENLGTGEGNPKAAPILVAAKAIFGDVQAEDWSGLHRRMTPHAGLKLPQPQLAAQCETTCKRFGVPASVEILEIHLAEFAESPTNYLPGGMRAAVGHSQVLAGPVILASPVTGQAAVVLCRSTARDSGLKSWLTVVLHGVESGWGMVALNMNFCELNGRDGRWYTSRATEYTRKGMQRVAFLYENLGAKLLIPGPNIVARPAPGGLEHTPGTQAPANMPLTGIRPSETWVTDDGEEFVVEFVSVASGSSFLSLDIRYKSGQKELDSGETKTKRRKLFDYVGHRFPEYQEGFDGIFVGSVGSAGTWTREFFPFDGADEDAVKEATTAGKGGRASRVVAIEHAMHIFFAIAQAGASKRSGKRPLLKCVSVPG